MQTLTELVLSHSQHSCFSVEELVHLIPGTDDARYNLVKRALAAGEIIRIRRGLYCLAPQYRRSPLNLFAVAQHVYGPSYISLESALSHHGWIPEAVYTVTSASFGESTVFETPVGTFSYTRVPQDSFYAAVDRVPDTASGDIALIARPLKALSDYVYAYRKDWSSSEPAIESLRIEPEDLSELSSKEIEEVMHSYRNKRVIRFLSALREEYKP